MDNNNILRRIRYTFNYDDAEMVSIFGLADHEVSREDIVGWLKKEDDPTRVFCEDEKVAIFLNGFINKKRGKKDGPQPLPEKSINNNIVFRKLKIALNLNAEDTIDILEIAEFPLGKGELSAFFRKPGHKHYRECQDQVLRKFFKGMQLKYRPKTSE